MTKKKKKKKEIKLRVASQLYDSESLRNQLVAFNLDDGKHGTAILEYFGGYEELEKRQYKTIRGKNYVYGTVIGPCDDNKAKNVKYYKVQFENKQLRVGEFEVELVHAGMNLYQELNNLSNQPTDPMHPVNIYPGKEAPNLFTIGPDEEGDPFDSDIEILDESDRDEDDLWHHTLNGTKDFKPAKKAKKLTKTEKNDEKRKDYNWLAHELDPPDDKANHVGTHIHKKYEKQFQTSIGSFLAFFPPKLFKTFVFYTNIHADLILKNKDDKKINNSIWRPVKHEEMFIFFGILIKMVLRPTPGQDYTACWDDPNWHPYTKKMRRTRFKQIRSVIHFSDDTNIEDSNDSLHKVRIVLNTLKETFSKYLEVGNELAIDEASLASRSAYGRHYIFFNPTKPGAKYHFRFYLICCSETYACVRIRMHTRDNDDKADTVSEENDHVSINNDTTNQEDNQDDQKDNNQNDKKEEQKKKKEENDQKVVDLVMNMCEPYFGSGRVINMDNYYTSPEVAVKLRQKGLYMRGTCRVNKIGFPEGVIYTKNEVKELGSGNARCMVDKANGLTAFGWVDGTSHVHFLSTADGSQMSEVKRKKKNEKHQVKAPLSIGKYNKCMHAVDRHDQMRETFSLSKRHGFQKYYIKIVLGLMDMALVNTWICYRMMHKEEAKENKNLRYEFMDSIAEGLMNGQWKHFQSEAEYETVHDDVESEASENIEDARMHEDRFGKEDTSTAGCTPYSVTPFLGKDYQNKRNGMSCQVCNFEGREGRVGNVNMCLRHRLRLCTQPRDDQVFYRENPTRNQDTDNIDEKKIEVTDYSWRCPDSNKTCWEKAHEFYIPKGLFKNNVGPICIPTNVDYDTYKPKFQTQCTSNYLYKAKRKAQGKDKPKHNGGRKNKIQVDLDIEEKDAKKENGLFDGSLAHQVTSVNQDRCDPEVQHVATVAFV